MAIEKIGSGLEVSEKEDCYIFRVMKDGNIGISKSGKSTLLATTHGAVEIDGIMFNINVYKPAPKKVVSKKAKKPVKKLDVPEWD